MKRFIQSLLCTLAVMMAVPAFAKIVETDDITDLLRYVDRETVLILDIDNTLITPSQYLGTTKWGWNNVSRLEKAGYSHDEAMSETHKMFHSIWSAWRPRLVDERIPQLVRRFQDQGVVVIGLSNRDPSLGFVTSDQLAAVGIDLTRTALDDEDFQVFSSTDTHYTEGVILVGDMGDKGEALDAFLRMVLHLPGKVVYVDDRMRNVNNVNSALRDLGVDFVGMWYRKGEEWIGGYRQDYADVQERHFEQILSDEDAEKLLQAGITR